MKCNLCGYSSNNSKEFTPVLNVGHLCLSCLMKCTDLDCIIEKDGGLCCTGRIDTICIERSNSGLPVIWESGGGYTNTGYANLIGDCFGGKKKPIFVRTSGHLACAEHALFVVHVNDVIVTATRENDFIRIGRVLSIAEGYMTLLWEHICEYGDWDREPSQYKDIVDAARAKCRSYHCRHSMYMEG